MRKLIHRNAYIIATICLAAFVVFVLLLYYQYVRRKPITSWDCPRMNELEKECLSLWADYNEIPWDHERWGYKNGKLNQMLNNILKKGLTDPDLHGLAKASKELPMRADDMSDFDKAVLKYMLMEFIQSSDRQGLVKLLSSRFTDQIGFQVPIEYGLVLWGKGMKNPILLLGDAYKKCEEPQVRHHIAVVVRRAFIGLGIKAQNDEEFIENAMKWYKENKEHLTVNMRYAHPTNTISYDEYPEAYGKTAKPDPLHIDPAGVWAKFKNNPLFVEKSPEDKSHDTD